MKCVRRTGEFSNRAADQIRVSRRSQPEFSHPEGLPVIVTNKRNGWWARSYRVTTIEEVWYIDPVVEIRVPKGFTCDLASVPAALWWIVSPWDIAVPAIFHDQNYREQKISREFADFLLRYQCGLLKVPFPIRWAAYFAVRLFGRRAWARHAARIARAKKPSGEPD